MASTNKTTNYNLSQYIGSDKPTYLGDYNADMLKIDNAIHQNALDIATADEKATLAGTNANTALTNASNAQTTADTANTTANSALSKATEVESTLTSYSTVEDFSSQVVLNETPLNPRFQKNGHIITINYQGEYKTNANNDLIFTLPEGYRPLNDIGTPFVKGNASYGIVNIDASNGRCIIGLISNSSYTGRTTFSLSYCI